MYQMGVSRVIWSTLVIRKSKHEIKRISRLSHNRKGLLMTLGWNRNDEERDEDDSVRKAGSRKADTVGNIEGLRKSRGTQERNPLELRQGHTIIIPRESIHAS